jgi:hypothetical protein
MKLLGSEVQIAAGFLPVNLATGANAGDWVCLKNYRHVAIVFYGDGGTAAEPVTITVEQASAVAGTGAKALTFTRINKKQGADLFAIGQFTEVLQAAANTYALGSGAGGDLESIVVIEINAEDLDVENGFDCVRATIADVGTGAQIGALLYILTGPRYTPPPSAIVD